MKYKTSNDHKQIHSKDVNSLRKCKPKESSYVTEDDSRITASKCASPTTRQQNAISQASAAVYLNSSVFWDVTQRRLDYHRRFGTYSRTTSPSKMETTRSSETSVLNQGTLRNIPEDRRIKVSKVRKSNCEMLRKVNAMTLSSKQPSYYDLFVSVSQHSTEDEQLALS